MIVIKVNGFSLFYCFINYQRFAKNRLSKMRLNDAARATNKQENYKKSKKNYGEIADTAFFFMEFFNIKEGLMTLAKNMFKKFGSLL